MKLTHILIVVFVVLLCTSSVFATIINVPTQYTTIQEAINAAVSGDTILVGIGNFPGNLTITGKRIAIFGVDARATIISPSVPNNNTIYAYNVSDSVIFSNFTVTGGGSTHTVMLYDVDYAVVKDCIFHNNIPIGGNNIEVISCNLTDVLITRNLFYENGGIGCVGLRSGSQSMRIINNTFDRNERGFFTIVPNGTAINNIVSNSLEYGINASDGNNFVYADYNDVYNNVTNYGYSAVPGPNDLSADPLYVNTIQLDYRLLPFSPCIDAGDPDPLYNDFDGSRNDMGAYPFTSTGPYALNLSIQDESSLNVLNHTPVISWLYYDPEEITQASYEVEIGTDSDWSVAEMWATGVVSSSDTFTVYDGLPLQDGETYILRCRVSNSVESGEWRYTSFRMNSTPDVPVLVFPAEEELLHYLSVYLEVSNSNDAEGDAVTYDFEVYSDAGLTTLIESFYDVAEEASVTNTDLLTTLVEDETYWWRVRAYDGFEYSDWASTNSFNTRNNLTVHVPTDYTTIQNAINASSDYDIIIVEPGVYIENLDFLGKQLRLRSQDGADVTIIEPASQNFTTVNMSNINGVYVEFIGFTVRNGGTANTVTVVNTDYAIVQDNIFHSNISGVINPLTVLRTTDECLIEGNLFYNNGGINVIYATGPCTIINNTIDSNERGVYSTNNSSVTINNIITNNIGYSFTGTGTLAYNNIWNNGSDAAGTNQISEDPLFVDPVNYDYTLLPYSPCVDAGDPDPMYNDPDGTRNDIGAYSVFFELPIAGDIGMVDEDLKSVVSHTPEFSWIYLGDGSPQISFEIEVGIDRDWSVAEMWNPGEQFGEDTSIVYAGVALENSEDYWCRIRINDGFKWGSWVEFPFHMNTVPSIPSPLHPDNDGEVHFLLASLVLTNASDLESQPLTYDFQLYDDITITNLVQEWNGVAEGVDTTTTGVISGLDAGVDYYWRVRSFDGYEYSNWSFVSHFTTNMGNNLLVPSVYPTIQSAINAAADYDYVTVSPGTYNENINFNGKTIKVRSLDGPFNTIIHAVISNASVVNMSNIEGNFAELDGFTVENGGNVSTVVMSNSEYIQIRNNIFRYNISGVINPLTVINANRPCLIKNNIFYENGGINVIYAQSSVDIINNTIVENERGIFANYNSSTLCLNNIVVNNSGYGIDGDFDRNDYNDAWNNGSSNDPGPNGISADPMFIDAANRDYRLNFNSPCINAGDPDIIYNDPDGSRADMGATPAVVLNIVGGNLTNVTNHQPEFFWVFSSLPGSQLEYEFEVGTDEDWTLAEMWSTGQVVSPDTNLVYAGAPLVDGERYYCRLRLNYDMVWSEWFELEFRMNSIPAIPVLQNPINGTMVHFSDVELIIENAQDGEADILSYEFEVYDDALLTNLTVPAITVPSGSQTTSSGIINGLTPGDDYWWRVRSYDAYEYSDWSDAETFNVRGSEKLIVPTQYTTIQSAIYASYDYDTVFVLSGNYVENIDFMGKSIRVISQLGASSTTLRPNNPSVNTVRIYNAQDTAEFSGFTLKNGGDINTVFINNDNTTTKIFNNIFTANNLSDITSVSVIRVESPALIKFNLFYDNFGGTTIASIDYSQIINNTFDGNRRGIYSSNSQTVLMNNIIVNHLGYAFNGNFAINDYNDNFGNLSNNNPGPNGISLDPLFTDPVTANYLLQPISPCIDAGNPDPAYNDNDGSRNDIGAYPFDYVLPVPTHINLQNEFAYNVVNHTPVFTWRYFDYSGSQYAYEIQVGSDNDWTNGAELWASGIKVSPDSTSVYAGIELINGQFYYYRMRVNNGDIWGDWIEMSFRMNTEPTSPVLLSPVDTTIVITIPFKFLNSSDVQNDNLIYEIEVYDDIGLSNLIYFADSIVGGNDSTVFSVSNLVVGVQYWWRVRAYDGYEYSEYSAVGQFETRGNITIHVPLDVPTIQLGIANATGGDTVLVGPGTYMENINFNGKTIIFKSSAGTDSTVLMTSIPNQPILTVSDTEAYITRIEGFTFDCTNATEAIFVGNGAGPTILHNVFTNHNVSGGIITIDDAYAIIKQNLFYQNPLGIGIFIRSGETSAEITNNTIDQGAIGLLSQEPVNVFVYNNIITNCTEFGVQGTINQLDYNNVWNNNVNYMSGAVAGFNSLSVDPKYMSLVPQDYYLAPNSPCRDKGNPSNSYNDPDGSRNDLGAYYSSIRPPTNPILAYPGSSPTTQVYDMLPEFVWRKSLNQNEYIYDQLTYSLVLSIDSNFTFVSNMSGLTDTTYQFMDSLNMDSRYWWKVIASNSFGLTATSFVRSFHTWTLGDVDHNNVVDIADLVYMVDFMFIQGSPVEPIYAADFDGSCIVDVADLVYLVDYMFTDGPPPQVGCELSKNNTTTLPKPKKKPINDTKVDTKIEPANVIQSSGRN